MDRKVTFDRQGAIALATLFAIGLCASTAWAATDDPPLQLIYAPWMKFCPKGNDANAKRVCFTGRDGRNESGQPVIAAVAIETEGEPKKVLRITVPLGLLLIPGTRLTIDSKPPTQAAYVMCFPTGCLSDYEATPQLIANLRNGKNLVVEAISGDNKSLSFPVPIGSEFAKAYDGPPSDPKDYEAIEKKLQEEVKQRQQATAQKQPSNTLPVVAPPVPVVAPPVVVATVPATAEPISAPARPAVTGLPPLGRRVALIIGNSAYKFMPTLTNPGNDAIDVEATLKSLGFDTVMATNLDRTGMNNVISQFSRKVAGADVALVYYSGHGMQFAGRNYLLPTDANLETADDVNRFQLMPVDDLIDVLSSAKGLQLIVLDACRNNPVERDFKNRVASAAGGSRDAAQTRGFSRIDARSGLVVTFATAANDVASDGTGRNSPFTKAFLKNVVTPNMEVRQMLYHVQSDVYASTTPRQLPEISSQYIGPDILLKPTSSN